MKVLTTNGYKPIEDLVSSDDLIAYDVYTGNQIINHLNYKQKWTECLYEDTASVMYDEWDGNNNITKTGNLLVDYPWQFYKINDTWTLYAYESIWINTDKVVHVNQLQIGDIIYDENDNDIIITDIQPVTSSEWWRLSISGDHSYIADGLTLHNPSRYWVGGGSSTNYNATANTNWASTSGGANNASVPTASDDIFYDGSGSRAQDNCNLNAAQTVLSATFTNNYSGSFTASAQFNINGNFTCNPNNVFTNSTNRFVFTTTSSIATNGKTIPFAIALGSNCLVTVSGSDLSIISSTLTGSTAGLQVLFGAAGGTINRFSNERVLACGLSTQSTTAPRLLGNIDIYFVGGNLTYTAGGGAAMQPPIFLSASFSSITITRLHANQITYITGSIISTASTLIIPVTTGGSAPGCILNTPGITFTTVNSANSGPAILFLSSSLTASNISLTTNINTIFTGSDGFTTNTLTYSSNAAAARTLTLQAGNTYTVTGSLNIGTVAGAYFPNIVTSGSGGGGLALPKLILSEGATCQAAANFLNIDASGGRTINTFSGSLTNTTNIRSFTDYPTTAFSRIT